MGIEKAYENEMDGLDEDLANGEITRKEYDRAVRDLEKEAAEIMDETNF